jgi:protein involved in polysaccharide export with SLBB domain
MSHWMFLPLMLCVWLQTPRELAADEKYFGAAILTSMESLDDSRRLESGDELSLRILEDRHPAVGLRVLAAGEIDAPYLGKVHAAGLTSKQLAFRLKSKLQMRLFFHPPFFRKPLLRKATVIVCIDKLGHPVFVTHCH